MQWAVLVHGVAQKGYMHRCPRSEEFGQGGALHWGHRSTSPFCYSPWRRKALSRFDLPGMSLARKNGRSWAVEVGRMGGDGVYLFVGNQLNPFVVGINLAERGAGATTPEIMRLGFSD